MGFAAKIKAGWTEQLKFQYRPGLATDLSSGADWNIFTVNAGCVLVIYLFGHVTTVIGAGAAVPRLQFTPTGGAQTPMAAAMASIATDAVNSLYVYNGVILTVPAPAAALGFADAAETAWCAAAAGGGFHILVPGTIACTNAVASTGIIDWYIGYIPCQDGASIEPA